jgi:uncharacterized repeat protein (TIGR03803 family)
VLGPDDNLYATSMGGGDNGAGTIFRMTESNPSQITVLYSFDAPAGEAIGADSPLILAPDGQLYGTTANGGAPGNGEIFRISTGGAYTDIFDFPSGLNDPFGPESPLTLAPNGDFYGTTNGSGRFPYDGIVYEVSLGSRTEYALQAGAYQGLFDDNDDFLTLNLSASGAFSGEVILGGGSYRLVGAFTPFGQYTGSVGKGAIPVSLSLGVANGGGALGDNIASGSIDGSPVTAYHAAYAKNGVAAEAGSYPLNLTSAVTPAGPSDATLTIAKGGSSRFKGKLPDGASFSYSSLVVGGPDGDQCLIYSIIDYKNADPKNARGFILGPITFPAGAVTGPLEWIKPQQTKGAFPAPIDTTLTISQ